MESILLKLEIRLSGSKGKLEDFLKVVGAKPISKNNAIGVIHATAFVKDDSEFSRIYTATNKELINWIRIHKPESVYEAAKALKKDLSNLSKTLRSLAQFSLVRLEEGNSSRRALTPFVDWDQLEVRFPVSQGTKRKAA